MPAVPQTIIADESIPKIEPENYEERNKLLIDAQIEMILMGTNVTSADKLTVSDVYKFLERSLKPDVSLDESEKNIMIGRSEDLLKSVRDKDFSRKNKTENNENEKENMSKIQAFNQKFKVYSEEELNKEKELFGKALRSVQMKNPRPCTETIQALFEEYESICED